MQVLLFVFITLVLSQDGALGSLYNGDQSSKGLEDLSGTDYYSDSDLEVKRNSYQVVRNVEPVNSADRSNICYFIRGGETENQMDSQISCRLRFTRSKFNFNPFGLRFGKRQSSSLIAKRPPVMASSDLLPFRLHLKDQPLPLCEHQENC